MMYMPVDALEERKRGGLSVARRDTLPETQHNVMLEPASSLILLLTLGFNIHTIRFSTHFQHFNALFA